MQITVSRRRVDRSQTQFLIKGDPQFGQLSEDLTWWGYMDPAGGPIFCGKLTNFWVIVDAEWGLTAMDSFRVTFAPVGCKTQSKQTYNNISDLWAAEPAKHIQNKTEYLGARPCCNKWEEKSCSYWIVYNMTNYIIYKRPNDNSAHFPRRYTSNVWKIVLLIPYCL